MTINLQGLHVISSVLGLMSMDFFVIAYLEKYTFHSTDITLQVRQSDVSPAMQWSSDAPARVVCGEDQSY